MATQKPRPIRAVLGFRAAVTDADVLARASAVLTGMTGNVNFPTPPIDMNTLKAAIDTYSAAITAAMDGSKKAIAARHKDREAVIRILRQLGMYVEAIAYEDMAIFTTSGFEAVSNTRTPAQPLTQPVVRKVEDGANSGSLLVRITAIANARSYDLQYEAANVTPPNWTTKTVTAVQKGVLIDGLTQGTVYAFRVRALGPLGPTDWSNPFTLMCR